MHIKFSLLGTSLIQYGRPYFHTTIIILSWILILPVHKTMKTRPYFINMIIILIIINELKFYFNEKTRYTSARQYVKPYEKNHGNKVAGPSRDSPLTFKQHFFDVPTKSEVTRPSADCQTTVLRGIKQLEEFLKKVAERSRDSGWGHATVGRLSNNVFGCFKQLENFLKKVTERSRDSGRRSRDHRPTVKQRFFDVSSKWKIFWKKSLNGHVTVVGGHATVGRLSNNVFSTFQAIRKSFEKSRWTVTRQWSEVTRPSADCQTTFFGRFKRFGKILKKVAERSRDSGWGHATVDRLSNNVFWTFQAIWENFEKSRWTVTQQWSEVTRPSADCQTTFFGRFKQLEHFLKKVAERSRDSGRRSRDRRPTVKQRFWTFQAIRTFFEKSRWMVTRQWSEITRPSADCQTTFFRRFKQLEKIFEKSRWTVTRQWSEVTRPSADCQTTFFGRFKQFGKILKKVAERSRDSGRRSRDHRPTVKQRFLDVSSNLGEILKKVAERSRDSGRRSRDHRPTVKQRFLDVSSN